MMLILIALAVILIGLTHWYINGSYNFWKKRGVPNHEPKLIFGNILDILTLKRHLGIIYFDLYNSYKDYSYVGFYKMLQPGVVLRNVDLIKEVTTKEFSSFHDNDIYVDEESDPLFGKNPFILKGERWKAVRSQVTTAITSGKIKQMFLLITDISKGLVKYLDKESVSCGKDGINAKDLSVKFTTNVVASCAFGLDGEAFTNPNSEFIKWGKKMFNFSFFQNLKFTAFFLWPKLTKWLKPSFISQDVRQWFIGTLQQTIQYREKNNIVRNDYLDLMMSLKNKPGDYQFKDIDVMAQCMTFFSDGMETSAGALSFILYELAKNSDVQVKLREEINTVLAKCNGNIEYDAIQEMKYMDMVISETLRKYPPLMFLSKVCTKQFTMPPPRGPGTGPGVTIYPGMSVVIPVYAIHYDPQYYPNPDKFDPERFTEENKKNRPKGTHIPFGDGPRMCLGSRFALTQIKAALAATVSNFEINVNPKTEPTMVIDPMSLILAKRGGIWLDFKKISK